jgi:hypothetical protein
VWRRHAPRRACGKFLLFSDDFDLLFNIALREVRKDRIRFARIRTKLIGKANDFVLELFARDNSRSSELAQEYGRTDGLTFRGWKSVLDTLKGKHSKWFLSKLSKRQAVWFTRRKKRIVSRDLTGEPIMIQTKRGAVLLR